MWRTKIGLGLAIATTAYASSVPVEIAPIGPKTYRLSLATDVEKPDGLHAEISRRASLLCGGSYKLAFDGDRVKVCSDACEAWEASVATLTCEAA